jgi:hypothetical protein
MQGIQVIALSAKRRAKSATSKHSSPYVVLFVVGVAASSSILGAVYLYQLFTTPITCAARTANVPRYVQFTVVISLAGYNGSANHNGPWPLMKVSVDWDVIIHLLNNDTSQSHGFAITHYFEQGVVLQPGKSCDLAFFASQTGVFPVYNTIFDTTDRFEHAQLNVNP